METEKTGSFSMKLKDLSGRRWAVNRVPNGRKSVPDFDFNLSGMPVLNANINPKGFTDNHLTALSGLMIYKGIFSYFCTP